MVRSAFPSTRRRRDRLILRLAFPSRMRWASADNSEELKSNTGVTAEAVLHFVRTASSSRTAVMLAAVILRGVVWWAQPKEERASVTVMSDCLNKGDLGVGRMTNQTERTTLSGRPLST